MGTIGIWCSMANLKAPLLKLCRTTDSSAGTNPSGKMQILKAAV